MKNPDRFYSAVRIFFYLLSAPIFFLPLPSRTEDIKIVKVLDCNLFEIKGGQRIRLVHVDAVSVTDTIKKVSSFAHNIKYYAKREFVGQTLNAEFIHVPYDTSGVIPVHLIRKFPLKTVNYNKLYLERGYGIYAEDADTLYRKEYLAAEEIAQLKNRGIWNDALYTPGKLEVHAASLTFGSGSYHALNGTYGDFSLNSEPLGSSNGFGIQASAFFWNVPEENSIDMKDAKTFYFRPYWIFNHKYAGIEPGFVLFTSNDFDFMGSSIKFLIWPSFKLNMGYTKRIYLSFDFFTDLLYSPASFGVNYINERPYVKLWLGYCPVDKENKLWSFKADGLVTQRLLIKFQGIYYNYFQNNESSYGWRIGIGYVLD